MQTNRWIANLLMSVCAGILILAGSVMPIFALLAPFAVSVLWTARGWKYALSSMILGHALIVLLLGWHAVAAMACLMPAGIALPMMLGAKRRSLETVLLTGLLLFFGIAMCFRIMLPQGISEALGELQSESLRMLPEYFKTMGIPELQISFYSKQFVDFFAMLKESMLGIACSISMLTALLMFVVSRKAGKAVGRELAGFPDFAFWYLPKGFGWGAIILFAAALILPEADVKFTSASYALQMIVSIPMQVQGLCLLEYLMSQRARPFHKAARVVILILAGLYGGYLLFGIGMFECMFQFRRKRGIFKG